nr:hypothetical protein [Salmonella enterica subsp. enterica serovar Dublin]
MGAAYSSSDRTDAQVGNGYGDGHRYYGNNDAGGETAEAWTVGVKYDAYNVYLAAMYSETRNMTSYGTATITLQTVSWVAAVSLTKPRTLKWLHSISSISVCVRPSPTCSLRAKI